MSLWKASPETPLQQDQGSRRTVLDGILLYLPACHWNHVDFEALVLGAECSPCALG